MKAPKIIANALPLIAIGSAIVVGALFWLSSPHKPAVGRKPVRPVRAIRLGDVRALAHRSLPGGAGPTREAVLSFRVGGPLIELPVMERGARAEDIEALEAKLRSAAAGRTEAEKRYQRVKVLHDQQVCAVAELDRVTAARDVATAAYDVAAQALRKAKAGAREENIQGMKAHIQSLAAKLEAASSALDDTNLRAPFAGYVALKHVENFQKVLSQQPIAFLEDHSEIEITVDVPEDTIFYRSHVQSIMCRFQAFPDREFPAAVKEIGTVASRETSDLSGHGNHGQSARLR